MENSRLRGAAPTSVNVTVGNRGREYLTDREVERLVEAAKQNRSGHRNATVILVAYRHGLRASELVALRWDGHGENIDKFRSEVENEVRYANIAIIEGTGASQLGIGMATAKIVEAILRDEQAVMPIGAFNPNYGTTLSLPSVLGRAGVSRILEPDMSEDELQGLKRSAGRLRDAVERIMV
jgi:malate/lactate dehydrogenase